MPIDQAVCQQVHLHARLRCRFHVFADIIADHETALRLKIQPPDQIQIVFRVWLAIASVLIGRI